MSNLTVLVLGSGGREHALVRGLAADPTVAQIHVAPGNPGCEDLATNHEIDPLDSQAVVELAREVEASFVLIGPEAPLAAGISDALRQAGIPVFGPSKAAAQLESSKSFAKRVMEKAGVPTAGYVDCKSPEDVGVALEKFGAPYVVKHDGLEAGKGVLVTNDLEEAIEHATKADEVVIEEYLEGPEVSLFFVTDGQTALPMMPAQDFKRLLNDDRGPNTGGMGAYTPLPWLDDDFVDQVQREVADPVLAAMRDAGMPFVGLLYVGLAVTKDGPKVIEFNARFGDPETQVLIATLVTPLGQLLYSAATGKLAEFGRMIFEGAAVCVVVAAEGYPVAPKKGGHLDLPADTETAHVIHAGTARDPEGDIIANGGRVLTVVGLGKDVPAARNAAYNQLTEIEYADAIWRTDIASDKKLSGAASNRPV